MSERELMALMASVIWSGPRAHEFNLGYDQAAKAAAHLLLEVDALSRKPLPPIEESP